MNYIAINEIVSEKHTIPVSQNLHKNPSTLCMCLEGTQFLTNARLKYKESGSRSTEATRFCLSFEALVIQQV